MLEKISFRMKDMPPGEKPREKILEKGAGVLSNAELLSVLIQTGTEKCSALDLARQILCMSSDGILALSGFTQQELMSVKGIGPSKACQILAGVELGKRVYATGFEKKEKITTPEDVAWFFMPLMRRLCHEEFHVCFLNTKNEIFSHEKVSMGSLNASIVHPREVFGRAVRKSASALILVHNHPSGHPEPSKEDLLLTKRLILAGDLLGIRVLDHLIIGDGRWYSMKAQGDIKDEHKGA